MSDLSIPGVTDTYKTNDLISSLMKLERVPRERVQETLEKYTAEQNAWRGMNRQMTALRDSARTLYSYNNPFNEKTAESSNPEALTADISRDASFETIKLDIRKIAAADRFMSRELDRNYTVPAGNYIFSAGDNSVNLNWRGGKVQDFVTSLNRRSNNTVRAAVIGISGNSQALLVESLQQGADKQLTFGGAALDLALDAGLIEQGGDEGTQFGLDPSEVKAVPGADMRGTAVSQGSITAPPRSAFQLMLPEQARSGEAALVEFSVSTEAYIPEEPQIDFTADSGNGMEVPGTAGSADFRGVSIENRGSEAAVPEMPPSPAQPEQEGAMVFLRLQDGSEIPLEPSSRADSYTIDLSSYGPAESIVLRNTAADKTAVLENAFAYTDPQGSGYHPLNPVETAGDAEFTYQGIRITRGTNSVDDLIPGVTLNLHAPTERTATLTIESNIENSKEAIITMVGNYNRLMAELNILTQNKPELISEIGYFTEQERKDAETKLGMFSGDFTLVNEKNTLQRLLSASYRTQEDALFQLMDQIGISTKSGTFSGYSENQYRGYLEIDEKKLDKALGDDISGVKNLFGFDGDGDLIIDTGLAYELDRNLQSFVQIGGVIAAKTSGIDTKIKSTQEQINRLDVQLARKEQELRKKYGSMEGSLKNLESQSSAISNFNNSQNNRNR